MTKNEIQNLLERLSRLRYIDAIEELYKAEKEYKAGTFFKNHKIPLVQLFKEYLAWGQYKRDIVDELDQYLRNLNFDFIIEKISNLLTKINEDPTIIAKFEGVFDKFNVGDLEGYIDKIQKEVKNLQR